jgi:hypothetical protein
MQSQIKIDVDNGSGQEITLEVFFEYEPAERQTHWTPYCPPNVIVYGAEVDGGEICLLPQFNEDLANYILQLIQNGEILGWVGRARYRKMI